MGSDPPAIVSPDPGPPTGTGVAIGLGVISFDIDGTLESGDPPGPVTVEFVRTVQARGFIIGSCSDRTLFDQRAIWQRLEVSPDFMARKTELPLVREQFRAHSYVHIGDTTMDEIFAKRADFAFYWPWDVPVVDPAGWIELLRTRTVEVD